MSMWSSDYEFRRNVNKATWSTLSEWIRDSRSAWTVVLITITAEIMIAVVASVAGDKLDEFLDDENKLLFILAVPFVIGTMLTAAVYRLFQIKLPSVSSGWLGSEWMLWVIAIGGGLANLAALFLLYSLS
jgi:hypothetical protein